MSADRLVRAREACVARVAACASDDVVNIRFWESWVRVLSSDGRRTVTVVDADSVDIVERPLSSDDADDQAAWLRIDLERGR